MVPLETIHPLVAGAPAAASLATLGWSGWNREMRRRFKKSVEQERARREHLLVGSSLLRPEGQMWRRSRGQGQIEILSVGTYSSRQLPFILRQFERAAASEHIGVVYL